MGEYFDINYAGPPFELFGSAHLGLILVAVVAGTLLVRAGRNADASRRLLLRRALGLFLIVNELGTHAWKLSLGEWSTIDMLPFQMCSAMAWISGLTLLLGWRKTFPLVYFFGIGGAVQGVLTPDANWGFPHYQMIETIVSHSTLVIGGLWVVLVEGYRPRFRELVGLMILLNAVALMMYFINVGLGSNYLFVNGKPPNASVVDFMPPWPWYIPYLEVIAWCVFGAMYLPFARRSAPALAEEALPEAEPVRTQGPF